MSNNTTERVFVPGSSAKGRETKIGQVINVSFDAKQLGEFVKEYKKEAKNGKSYINLSLVPRKETGPYGDTHSIQLDTWEPTEKAEAPAPATKKSAPKKVADEDQEEIPF